MAELPQPDKRKLRHEESWTVLFAYAENLYIVGAYRERAVSLLKMIVPQGARRFYRQAGPEFFTRFQLSQAQVDWLTDARLFRGSWEVLSDYRRSLVEALEIEYKEAWLVEKGRQKRLEPDLISLPPSLAEKYGLGEVVSLNLGWAKSFALYCHRHRTFELKPCKETGIFSAGPIPPSSKRKRGDTLLRAPRRTLIRARRQQTSYYLAAEGDVVRLGRDEAGEEAVEEVVQGQRLALILRAASTITTQL